MKRRKGDEDRALEKVKVAILGTGNIGMDLLFKVRKSSFLECGIFAGHNPDSKNIQQAIQMGVPVTYDSIDYLVRNPQCCDIVFDATSANVHMYHAPILKKLGKFTIDLTPAHIGPFCIPTLNADAVLKHDNINMITCGGQATVPIAVAISRVQPNVKYFEMIATIASKSAGPGTRANIDEFTQTTSDALRLFTGIEKAKAIIVLNPANPPIMMRNTLYALVDHPDMQKIEDAVTSMVEQIRRYVSGYHMILPPVYENGRLAVSIGVTGSGDFLPSYAGNLDIITCAAVHMAEMYVVQKGAEEAKV